MPVFSTFLLLLDDFISLARAFVQFTPTYFPSHMLLLSSLHTLINKKHGQEGFCFFRPALDIVSRVNLRAKCPYPIITIIVMMTMSQHRTQQPMHPAHN